MGGLPTGALYLPYGDAVEGQMNYERACCPSPWVGTTGFSSRVDGPTAIRSPRPVRRPAGASPFGTEIDPVAQEALDRRHRHDHPTKVDPSHPAFYLPGQELESGNMRAFATLAPCRANTVSCESGADCCGGFCREVSRSPDASPRCSVFPRR